MEIESKIGFEFVAPILTPLQLQQQSKTLNAMHQVDFKKINEEMQKQVRLENNYLISQYKTQIDEINKLIFKKEEEKEFFNFRIEKAGTEDLKFIQYEKAIFDIEKEIENYNNEIKKIEDEIEVLKK